MKTAKVDDILVWLKLNLAVKGLKAGSRIGHLIKIAIVVFPFAYDEKKSLFCFICILFGECFCKLRYI